ncbi:MAG: hypothetical protein M1828_003010 [Chrysothrix sp. TS-e1954]|nr:MAG: hypothetical protein M1828_003010 [Chrysothrix sp. TS-e1954]
MALPDAPTTAQTSTILKDLVSSDPEARATALTSLRTYLSRRTPFTDLELLKLWKGLFYSMWMCDKPHTQQVLARDLAGLVSRDLDGANVMGFVDTFWRTLSREWAGIDGLRMDKFLYLARQMLFVSLEYLARSDFDDEQCRQLVRILAETPLNIDDNRIPNGIRYHVLDILVDELDRLWLSIEATADGREFSRFVDALVKPVSEMERRAVKPMRKRAKEVLENPELRMMLMLGRDVDGTVKVSAPQANGQSDTASVEEWGGFED